MKMMERRAAFVQNLPKIERADHIARRAVENDRNILPRSGCKHINVIGNREDIVVWQLCDVVMHGVRNLIFKKHLAEPVELP